MVVAAAVEPQEPSQDTAYPNISNSSGYVMLTDASLAADTRPADLLVSDALERQRIAADLFWK